VNYAALLKERANTSKMLGNLTGKNQVGDIAMDSRIILEDILMKYGLKFHTRLVWSSIEPNCLPFWLW
jgi:hypothetical protein